MISGRLYKFDETIRVDGFGGGMKDKFRKLKVPYKGPFVSTNGHTDS